MDRRARVNNVGVAVRVALELDRANLWTSMPAVVQKYNASKQTVDVQPAIQGRVLGKDGKYKNVNMPQLLDCPVQFVSGGGMTLTLPIKAGDEGLVVFASRCIDAWWQNGGTANRQMDLRMHDLSDGVFLPGIRSNPKALSSPDADYAVLRSDDNSTRLSLKQGTAKMTAGDGASNLTLGSDGSTSLTGQQTTIAGSSGLAINAGGSTGTQGQVLTATGEGLTTFQPPKGPTVNPNQLVANLTGAAAPGVGTNLTALLDAVFGTAVGNIIYRNTSAWEALSPGRLSQGLTAQGTGAAPVWGDLPFRGLLKATPSTPVELTTSHERYLIYAVSEYGMMTLPVPPLPNLFSLCFAHFGGGSITISSGSANMMTYTGSMVSSLVLPQGQTCHVVWNSTSSIWILMTTRVV